MAAKDDLGKRGEDLAAQFLSDVGYTVIDRNWRCPRGEIDLVARDGTDTVFIEVKTRSSTAFGHPFEAITTQKLARLRRLATAWCEAHPQHSRSNRDRVARSSAERDRATSNGAVSRRENRSGGTHGGATNGGAIRIDAISVIAAPGTAPIIEHLRRVY